MSWTRRQVLATLAQATAAGAAGHCSLFAAPFRSAEPPVKIDRIELFALRYPMTGYFKFFAGPHGSAGRAAVIVKITADNGTVGWGQSVPIAKWSYETLETATSPCATTTPRR